jgi:ectoine hydroxylase-related dioxygenase (phytanoyl-CoA dioxygenase family)
MNDLSRAHRPVSDVFPVAASSAERQPFRLSEEQVRFFHDHGYLAGVRILDHRQIEHLRREVAEVADPKHPRHALFYEFHSNESADASQVLFHALGAWRIAPGLHDILWHPAFTTAAAQLLGGAVRFWHDQLFCKPAHHGGIVAWHQDYSYWTRTRPVEHLTCWIGLDDATRESGCLHYVPGSHRWPLLPRGALANDMDAVAAQLTPEQRAQFQPVPVELLRGECSFHHSFTLHGSYANQTPRPRRAVVLNVFRDGVESASDEPLLAGVPPVPAGQKMAGQFFPLLYDPAAPA